MKKLLALLISGSMIFAAACATVDRNEDLDNAFDQALINAAELLADYGEGPIGADEFYELLGMNPEDFVAIAMENTNAVAEESYVMEVDIIMSMDMFGVPLMDMVISMILQYATDEDGEVLGFVIETLALGEAMGEIIEEEYSFSFYRDGFFYTYAYGELTREEMSFEEALGIDGVDIDLLTANFEELFEDLEDAFELTGFYLIDEGVVIYFELSGEAINILFGELLGDDAFGELFGDADELGDIADSLDFEETYGSLLVDFDGYLRAMVIGTSFQMDIPDVPGFSMGIGMTIVIDYTQLGGVEIVFPID